jgi:hypothetical protein
MPSTLFDVFSSYEVPENADTLTTEKRRDEFYKLIGQCIKKWADVETQLFELCVLALKSPGQQAAIVYYKSPTINSRLTLVDELLRAILPPRDREDGGHDHPLVSEWIDIFREIEAQAPQPDHNVQ